jgi:hypothetical protein
LDKAVVRRLHFEISEIDLMLDSHLSLIDKAADKKTTATETLALAAFLHAFYNSLENLFLFVARDFDHKAPEGTHRHKTLLDSMSRDGEARPALVSESTKKKLAPFLGFHYLFRNGTSVDFDKNKLATLAEGIFLLWETLKSEFETFIRRSE